MPFMDPDNPPAEIADLPKDAQEAWITVFNSAFRTFPGTEQEKHDAALIAAWTAIELHWKDEAGAQIAPPAFAPSNPSTDRALFGASSRIVKFTSELMEAKKRITYGEVYVPWEFDAHGDMTTPEVIEEAAHNFLAAFQDIGTQHKGSAGKGVPVESFLSRKGDRDFPIEGSWVLGTKWNEENWNRILSGELLGYSLDGVKTFVPIVAGREMTKAARKADDPEAEMIEDPEQISTNPRVLKLMTNLQVMRVDGVSMPANRKQWKLFKSIGGAPMQKRIVRVVGATKATPGGPFQKLYDQLIAQGMSPDDALRFVQDVLGPLPPGWSPDGMKQAQDPAAPTDQVISFAECAAQIDALLGMGTGVQVCSLMQAKYPAGPEGGITLPEGMSLEQAARQIAEEGQRAGFISLSKQASSQESILKSIKDGIVSILSRLGAKESEQVPNPEAASKEAIPASAEAVKETDPMTPEEKKAIDDRFASIEQKLSDILAAASGAPKAASAPAPAEPAAPVAAAPAEKEGAYAPTPEQAGADLIELAQSVDSIKSMLAQSGTRGRSAVREITNHPAHKGSAGNDSANDMAYSTILSSPISKSQRQRVQDAEDERREKKAERRKKRITLHNV